MKARTAHSFCSKIDWSSTSYSSIGWISNNHHQGSNRDVNNASDIYLFVVNSVILSDTDPFRIVLKFHQFHCSIIFVWFTFILDQVPLTTVKFQRDNYNPCLAINLGAWKIVQSLVSLYCDYLSQNNTNYNNTLISALTHLTHISSPLLTFVNYCQENYVLK